MNTPEALIQKISSSTNPELLQQQCEELQSREDRITMVPAIFSTTKVPLILMTGARILEDHVQANWIGLSADEKSQLRQFVDGLLQDDYISAIKSKLHVVLAKIAIRSLPDEWPEYLDKVLYSYDFDQFENFLVELERASSTKAEFLPTEKKNLIIQEINQKGPEFFDYFIRSYQLSDQVLKLFIPYIKFAQVSQVDFAPLFVEDSAAFGPLCSILQLEGIPEELVMMAFNCAANLEIESKNLYKIIPALQKHLTTLEKDPCIQNLISVHNRLFEELDFREMIYYWEGFVVQIYSEFCKTAGATNRFQLHYQILVKIRDYVIFHMEQPPDFIIPEIAPPTKDQEQREIYNSMRSILVSFVGMTPKEVNESFLKGIQILKDQYNDNNFLSIIWTLACITGATSSKLESIFVIESMKFVLQIFRHPLATKAIIASSFLYLASEYAKARQLTPEFIEQSIKLAIQALSSPKTQRIAANTLLSLSKNVANEIATIPPQLIEIVEKASMDPEIFNTVVESAARLYISKNKFDILLGVLTKRWVFVLENHVLNFDCVREELLLMNGFVGLSRVNPIAMEKFANQNLETLMNLTKHFIESIAQILEENGVDGLSRDDIRLMISFLRAETLLYTEIHSMEGGNLLTIFGEMPAEIRIHIPEMLLLLESLFKSGMTPENADALHNLVMVPIMEMIEADPEETRDHLIIFPRVEYAFAIGFSTIITQNDIDFLLEILKDQSHTAVLYTIKALDAIIEKNDLRLVEEPRDEFFRNALGKILYNLMLAIADPDHYFCYSQLLRFIYKICDLVISGKLRVNLFPDQENIPGLIMALNQSIVEAFPLVIPDEIAQILTYMFQPMPMEQFEEVLAQYIAKARQTTPSETLVQIRLQQFKDQNQIFYF